MKNRKNLFRDPPLTRRLLEELLFLLLSPDINAGATLRTLFRAAGSAGLSRGQTTAGRYPKGCCPPVHDLSSHPPLLPANWIGTERSDVICVPDRRGKQLSTKHCDYFITASTLFIP